jgi:hypothetical protein
MNEDLRGDPNITDRALITTILGIAGGMVLGLLAFALLTDFPGPPPAGISPNKTDAQPEDVRRSKPS